jgi:hypothetical protein
MFPMFKAINLHKLGFNPPCLDKPTWKCWICLIDFDFQVSRLQFKAGVLKSSQVRLFILFWILSTNRPILWDSKKVELQITVDRFVSGDPLRHWSHLAWRLVDSRPRLWTVGVLQLDWFYWFSLMLHWFGPVFLCALWLLCKRFNTWVSSLWIMSLEILLPMFVHDLVHWCVPPSASFVWNPNFLWCMTNFPRDPSLLNYRHL